MRVHQAAAKQHQMNLFAGIKRPIWTALIALGFFVLALLPRLGQLDAFLMVDENLWYQRSAHFLQGLIHGNLVQTVQTGHPGVTTMWSGSAGLGLYYGQSALPGESLPEFTDRMATTPVNMAILGWLRVPLALLSALGVALVFGLGQRLLGWLPALVGTGLLAFEPFFLAHSRVLHHDATTAIFSLLALLAWLLYLKERQWWSLLVAGIAVALAVLSKVSSLFLLLFMGLTLLPNLWQQTIPWTQRLRRIVVPWLQLAGITLLTVVLAWPALWVVPEKVFNTVFGFIGDESGAHANGSFFLGRFVFDPGPLFYPVSLPFDISPLTLIGALLAIFGLGFSWFQAYRQAGVRPTNNWPWIAWLLGYVVLFVIYMSFLGKKQQRYVLPAVVTLDMIAGWGWIWFVALGQSRIRLLTHKVVVVVLVVFLIGGQLALAQPHAPYYSTFYNPLLGGSKTAQQVLLVGRGEGLERAVAYVLADSVKPRPQIASWYGTTVKTLVDGRAAVKDVMHPNFILGSDYVFFYINQRQRQKPDQATLNYIQRQAPLHTVELAGIDYVQIYQGKAVSHPVDMYAEANRLVDKAYLAGVDLTEMPAAGASILVRLFWVHDGRQAGEQFYVRLTDELEQDWGWGTCHPDPTFGAPVTWREGQIIESECQLVVYPGTPPGEYYLRIGLSAEDGAVIGQIYLSPEEGTVAVVHPPAFPADEWVAVEQRTGFALNDALFLIGYDYSPSVHKPGEIVPLTFYWRALQAVTPDYTIRLTLQGDEPGQFAQWESGPVNGRYPTSVWIANEVIRDPWQIALPVSLPKGTYTFTLALIDQNGTEVGSFPLPALTIEGRDRDFTLAQPPAAVHAALLDQDIRFLGYDLLGTGLDGSLIPGEELEIGLIWQAVKTPPENYTVFVQLLDTANQLHAQHDGQPGDGVLFTTSWATGEYVRDTHRLSLPPDLPPGEYRLIVGMYLPATGARLPAFEEGQAVGDHITLGSFQVQ